MTRQPTLPTQIEDQGFAIRNAVLSPHQVHQLQAALDRIPQSPTQHRRGGIRNLLDESAEIHHLAASPEIRNLVQPILGPQCFPVRGILFDKLPAANWKVPWHQDLTIAVQNQVETEGFGPWSIKADVLHVQPTPHILEGMLSVRIHLDPCAESNGALRVIPGSHKQGRIPENRIPDLRLSTPEVICEVECGGTLLMRPLLLHASSPSQVPAHRRVIHLDFAATTLPNGLRWFSQPPSPPKKETPR